MTKIFKQLARHWAVCLVVFALLFMQAYCDLSLPDYTSKIVDTGIQQGGSGGLLQLAAAQHDAGLRGLALLGDFGHGLHVVGLTQRSQLGKAALAVPQALVEGEKDDLRRGSFD